LSQLSITFDSDLREVPLAAEKVRDYCAQSGLNDLAAYEMELCFCEAVVNVIRHGHRARPKSQIRANITACPETVVIDIFDEGAPIPPAQLEKITRGPVSFEVDTVSTDALLENGRGLLILCNIMDDISYSSEKGKNRLSMTKLLLTKGKACMETEQWNSGAGSIEESE